MSRRKYAQAANLKSSAKRPNDVRIHIAANGRAENRISIVSPPAWREPGRELLAIFRRHLSWITGLVALAAMLAVLFLVIREPSYTSSAIFQRIFMAETARGEDRTALDASALVKSQMFRLQSAEFSRLVIDRMTKERAPGQHLRELYPSIFRDLKDENNPTDYERDIANKTLLARLSVWNEAKTYVIIVAYTGVTPDEAARVVNLVMAQHERTNRIQNAAGQQSAAQLAIQKLSMTFGPKHPQMIRAVADLATARTRLDAEQNAPLMQERQLLETGDVIPARPVTIQSGMSRARILLFTVLLGLIIALMGVVIVEYRSIQRLITRHLNPELPDRIEPLHT